MVMASSETVFQSVDSQPVPPSMASGSLLERPLMGFKEKHVGSRNTEKDTRVVQDVGEVTPQNTIAAGSSQFTPLRRSKRREATADEDSIERASRLVAKRNLEVDEGKHYSNSILSFSNEHISDNIQNIGISIGKDANAVNSSVLHLKKVEKDRFKLPSTTQNCQDSHSDIDDSDCEIDHLALDHLCGDLTEELMDDDDLNHNLSCKTSKKLSVARKKASVRNTKIGRVKPTRKGPVTKKHTNFK